MVQATTPTFLLTLPSTVDLSLINTMMFTLEQGSLEIDKTGSDLEISGQVVSVYLTQEETMKFKKGPARLQLNWTYPDGKRACSNIVTIDVSPNLFMEVLE